MQRDPKAQGHQATGQLNGRYPEHTASTREARAELDQSDRALLARVRMGDGDALAALYDRYAATLIGLARGILRDPRLAEEATHDVFLGLWQNPAGYDASRGPFAGWLFRVARNRSIDLLRRRRDQPFAATVVNERGDTLDPATFLVDDEPDPADQAVVAIQREVVREALRELTADHRRLLELAYFSGMTQSEIATQLGRPLGTVKTQIRSAMKRLAEVLVDAAPLQRDGAGKRQSDSTGKATSRVSHRDEGALGLLQESARPVFDDVPGDSDRS